MGCDGDAGRALWALAGKRSGTPARSAQDGAGREYVAANYERDISVDELAELVGLSRYYLTRAFCKEFGLPPHAYATQVRLLAAKRMLASGQSAATAAAAVGFYDQSHLNRLFKRAYGITPGAYAALKPGIRRRALRVAAITPAKAHPQSTLAVTARILRSTK